MTRCSWGAVLASSGAATVTHVSAKVLLTMLWMLQTTPQMLLEMRPTLVNVLAVTSSSCLRLRLCGEHLRLELCLLQVQLRRSRLHREVAVEHRALLLKLLKLLLAQVAAIVAYAAGKVWELLLLLREDASRAAIDTGEPGSAQTASTNVLAGVDSGALAESCQSRWKPALLLLLLLLCLLLLLLPGE